VIGLKLATTNLLKGFGIYEPVYRLYYAGKTVVIGLFRSRATLSVRHLTRVFATPTPTHTQWIERLLDEREMLELFVDKLQVGDVVWDIGAHVGVYSLLAQGVVGQTGKVYAFEPEPRTYRLLGKNCQLNGVSNIGLLPMALGDEDGEAMLYTDWRAGLGIHKLFYETRLQKRGKAVTVHRGDTLIKNKTAFPPTVVKVDVEGWEYAVLRGMTSALSHCRLLLIEVHPQNLQQLGRSVEDVRAIVSGLGFEIAQQDERTTIWDSGATAQQIHWLCLKEVG
jgi:FkbM family methyltransferase